MSFRIHHLAFRTGDVAALAVFYRELLGLAVVRDELPRALWLGIGPGAVLMLEARADAEPMVAPRTMELVAFRVDPATRDRIRTHAIASGTYDGETESTVYLRDPDGRRIGVSTYDLSFVRG